MVILYFFIPTVNAMPTCDMLVISLTSWYNKKIILDYIKKGIHYDRYISAIRPYYMPHGDPKKQGITTPTKVQQQTIPPLLKGKDILCRAQTGTGKTLAFLLPILQQIQVTQSQEQVLILAPTRELANQITSVATTLGAPLHIDVLNLIGGKTIENQLQKLHRHPHLIIGTPGRLLDHCTRRALHLSGIRRIIVDEADQMLQQGFLEEVDTLIGMTSKRRQLLFFSATIPDKIKGLAKKHMNAPLVLSIQEGDTITLEQIEQRIYMIREEKNYPSYVNKFVKCPPT